MSIAENQTRGVLTFVFLLALGGCGDDVRTVRLEHLDGSTSPCADVTCPPAKLCELPGVCDPERGVCVYEAVVDDTPCDDGDACSYGESCQQGSCEGGEAVVCRASDACHTGGTCDAKTGCAFDEVENGTSCEDDNPCTADDVCTAGACAGSPKVCDAASECSVGMCNPANGACEQINVADGKTCSQAADGSSPGKCQELTCLAGSCASTDKQCGAIDDCHGPGTCDAGTGECSTPVLADGTSCEDGDVCSTGDVCEDGSCKTGAPLVCPAESNQCFDTPECLPGVGCVRVLKKEGVSCDDGDKCNGTTDSCSLGECLGQTPLTCPADRCYQAGVCDRDTGLCSAEPLPEGEACDDGDACTYLTTCNANHECGDPAHREAVVCAPATACQQSIGCDRLLGCQYPNLPDGTLCEEGDLCSAGDACVAGACVAGPPVACAETPDPCTSSACDPETGTCALIPLTDGDRGVWKCDDGNACTAGAGDRCVDGQCAGGSELRCEPQACKENVVCSPANGECTGIPQADGTPCVLPQALADPCSAQSACELGECRVATRVTCEASDAKHGPGVCDSATGDCTDPCKVTTPCTSGYCFADVTYSDSVRFRATPVAGAVTGAAAGAVLDFDGDGWIDIVMVTANGLLLLHNDTHGLRDEVSGFSDVTAASGLPTGDTQVVGVAVADYDNDGAPDIYVLRHWDASTPAERTGNQLWRNAGTSGDANFESASALETPRGNGFSTDAVFGDYDNDGRLDVFVTGSGPAAGPFNQLYMYEDPSNSPPVFENRAATKLVSTDLSSSAALFTDANDDRLPDIVQCNASQARLHLQAVAGNTNTQISSAGCAGIVAGDYDRDGDVDYYLASAGANALLSKDGPSVATFTDSASSLKATVAKDACDSSVSSPSWHGAFTDFNADALLDLFVVKGATSGAAAIGNALLVHSVATADFTNVGANALVDDSRRGRAVLVLDYDNDGDHDLFVINQVATGQLLRNEHNETATGKYLRLTLAGGVRDGSKVLSNRDGLGAKIELVAGGITQLVEHNRSTHGDGRMLFGVPGGANADIRVTWPSGVVQRVLDEPSIAFQKDADLSDNDRVYPHTVALVEPVITVSDVGHTWADDAALGDGGVTSSELDLHVTLRNASSARSAELTVVLVVQPAGGPFHDTMSLTRTVNVGANGNTIIDLTDLGLPFTSAEAPVSIAVKASVRDVGVTSGRAEDQLRKSLTLN